MIVVNLKKSVPPLLIDIRRGIPDNVILDQIEHVTRGDWGGISTTALHEHADYIAGAFEDVIVSVFKIKDDGIILNAADHTIPRITFEVEPAPEFAHMIGQPIPGGRWKRGEARPVRYLATAEVEHFLTVEVGVTAESVDQAVNALIVENLKDMAAGRARRVTPGSNNVLDAVEVTKNPRGGVTVTVPMGTTVTVVQREE